MTRRKVNGSGIASARSRNAPTSVAVIATVEIELVPQIMPALRVGHERPRYHNPERRLPRHRGETRAGASPHLWEEGQVSTTRA